MRRGYYEHISRTAAEAEHLGDPESMRPIIPGSRVLGARSRLMSIPGSGARRHQLLLGTDLDAMSPGFFVLAGSDAVHAHVHLVGVAWHFSASRHGRVPQYVPCHRPRAVVVPHDFSTRSRTGRPSIAARARHHRRSTSERDQRSKTTNSSRIPAAPNNGLLSTFFEENQVRPLLISPPHPLPTYCETNKEWIHKDPKVMVGTMEKERVGSGKKTGGWEKQGQRRQEERKM